MKTNKILIKFFQHLDTDTANVADDFVFWVFHSFQYNRYMTHTPKKIVLLFHSCNLWIGIYIY